MPYSSASLPHLTFKYFVRAFAAIPLLSFSASSEGEPVHSGCSGVTRFATASIIKKYNLEKYGFDDDDVWNRYYYMDQIFKYIG